MAFDGWFQFDGSEIINVSRTEQYCRSLGMDWLKPQYNNKALGYMLGDGLTYRTPLLDDAPWVDGEMEESLDFLGLYPLGVDSIESSTRTAQVYEHIGNGGSVRGVRHGVKTMVFSGALCATSEDGAEYGLRWLKQVLNGAPCGPGAAGCDGGELCYLSAEPDMIVPDEHEGWTISLVEPEGGSGFGEGGFGSGPFGGGTSTAVWVPPTGPVAYVDPAPCLTPYQRTLRNVTVTNGPIVTAKRRMSNGGAVWTVSFTMVAGMPYEFGPEVPIIRGFMHPTDNPWVDGIEGAWTPNPYLVQEAECVTPVYSPVYDPNCPALIPPPLPPTVALGCFEQPDNWYRRHITIPEQYVPLWGDVVPKIEVHAPGDSEVRAVRVRFYADPFGEGNPNIDPCAYCGDILISYIPRNSTLVFDGSDETVYIEQGGKARRRADSLVYKTDGTPFDWPVLTCGMGYVVTFDLPQTQVAPLVDLSLIARVI
jgi:hypothetical protein